MTHQRMTLVSIIGIPMLVSLVLIGSVLQQYVSELNQNIDDAYAEMVQLLVRAEKVVTALDYTFTYDVSPAEDILYQHSTQLVDNVCQIRPIDTFVLLRSQREHFAAPKLDLSYMLIGNASLCNSQSNISQSLQVKLSMAPMLSFLHDMDKYIYGVHYVDSSGYIISSPDVVSEKITLQQMKEFVEFSPLWSKANSAHSIIVVEGPYRSQIRDQHDWLLSLFLPVYVGTKYQGLVAVDIGIRELLGQMPHLASSFGIIDINDQSRPEGAYRPYLLTSQYADYNQEIFYQLDTKAEFFSLLDQKKVIYWLLL